MAKNRCINIDWLSVYCLEPVPLELDAQYFRHKGYDVEEREYGTPQYRQMFTLKLNNKKPFLEIRRSPYSMRGNGGFFEQGSCHIRLSNYMCYDINPVGKLIDFLHMHGYFFVSIQRIDICLDFHKFDSGKTPQKFVQRFMRNEISKINQCKVSAHGKDQWDRRDWNSLAWGSESSPIRTKFYNKSMEMKDKGVKFHIIDAWEKAGLDLTKDVYRVEFSIKSDVKGYVNLEKKRKMPNKLSTYDSREKCLFIFHLLANIYFHFKEVKINERGQFVRKDRCPDYVLFTTSNDEGAYKPCGLDSKKEPRRGQLTMTRELTNIYLNEFDFDYEERHSAYILLRNLYNNHRLNAIADYVPAVKLSDPPF